ncbi:MAG: hypothetical protein AABW79_02550 [Nanoarchaeota archaeon]
MNKGQVSIFVIIAIVIVGAVVVFFALTGRINLGANAGEFQPIFDRQKECIEQSTKGALELAGLQGGRVNSLDYLGGSDYAPFSSHLNFFGTPVKYWYYLSANGVFKEDIPTKLEIQGEIADYIEKDIENCDFSDFYEQGYLIEQSSARVSVNILDAKVRVAVSEEMSASKDGNSASLTKQNVEIDSGFGKFLGIARGIYDEQKTSAFLEKYAVDVLRNYAPVDGVILSCAPQTWKTQEVVGDIRAGLAANFGAIKFKGNYYALDSEEDNYFVVDQQTSVPVRVIYDRSWPSAIEITPADEALMIAKPVGNDPALGVMGFCYIPYHFVYDVRVPVLFQIYDGEDVFQFPVVVVVDNNLPRVASSFGIAPELENDICAFSNSAIAVKTFNAQLEGVEAQIDYQCFDSLCSVGTSKIGDDGAVLDGLVPGCVNGILHAQAEGYAEKEILFSSNSESEAEIILDRLYGVEIEVLVDGRALSGQALVQFVSPDLSASVSYPDSNVVNLAEGLYNISVYIYGNSSIVIPASSRKECQQVTRPGIAGIFGGTKEQCFDINLPETRIDYALLGGGNVQEYLLESQLQNERLILDVPSVPTPTNLEQVQYSFQAVQNARVEVRT